MDFYGKRNLIFFAWQNVSWPFFPFHLAVTTAYGAWYALKVARPRASWFGLMNGLWLCLTGRVRRAPVQRAIYRLDRRLVHGPLLLAEIESQLLPLDLTARIVPLLKPT
jgi:hypothetical protein